MIDFRHETFLALCRIKSYSKTAEQLHMTQPAVTQHIQHLEQLYGGKLFLYSGKTLTLTEKGQLLYLYTYRMAADSRLIRVAVCACGSSRSVAFGATLTIGEFVMPPLLPRVMQRHPGVQLHMSVENTAALLAKLDEGGLSFALLEGFFDKSQYGCRLFSAEKFIAVCSPQSPLRTGRHRLDELLQVPLILRETGSGTRAILEQLLMQRNLSSESFAGVLEIGNMSAIKALVAQNEGITFLYEAACRQELRTQTLCPIPLAEPDIMREFNFVYPQNSLHEEEYLGWFRELQQLYTAHTAYDGGKDPIE